MTDFTCPNCGQSCYPDDPCPCRDLSEEARAGIRRIVRWKDDCIADLEAEIAELRWLICDAANASESPRHHYAGCKAIRDKRDQWLREATEDGVSR